MPEKSLDVGFYTYRSSVTSESKSLMRSYFHENSNVRIRQKNAAKKVYRKWLQTPPADIAGLAW